MKKINRKKFNKTYPHRKVSFMNNIYKIENKNRVLIKPNFWAWFFLPFLFVYVLISEMIPLIKEIADEIIGMAKGETSTEFYVSKEEMEKIIGE